MIVESWLELGKQPLRPDGLVWGAPLLLGLLLAYSAISRPKPRARWYGRLIVGIVGVYLLYISAIRIFPLRH